MSKHTPGPWHVVGESDPEIHGPDGEWITHQVCSGAGDENNDGQANARLIAAAPDLLAACKAALVWFDAAQDTAAAKQLRTAIAKAEARQ